MSDDDVDPALAQGIAERGREVVVERLRTAFAHQAAARAAQLEPHRLEQMVQDAVRRAGSALWRRSLAEVAMRELNLALDEAVAHPAVARAHELVRGAVPEAEADDEADADAPPANPTAEAIPPAADTAAQALRLGAVHLSGIETLSPGDNDIELRLSDAGLDVLKRSTGAAIGRLEWSEIEKIDLPSPRRGLRGRGKTRRLQVSTSRGEAQFELPGLTEDELQEHVEPMLGRLRTANVDET